MDVISTEKSRIFNYNGKKYLYRKLRLADNSRMSVLGEVPKDFNLLQTSQSSATDKSVPNKIIGHRISYGTDGKPVAFRKYKDMIDAKPGLRTFNIDDASKIKLIDLSKKDGMYNIMMQGDYKSQNNFSRIETMIPEKRALKKFSDIVDVKSTAKKFTYNWLEIDCIGKFGELIATVRQAIVPHLEKLSLSDVFKKNNRLIKRFMSIK